MMTFVGDTPARMLQLLGLLQARPAWGGAELAERLEITERTVRRDVDRLRELGYPVEAEPGRHGGYRLGRGGRLPPLLLNDDEAVAVAIGLRSAVDGTVSGLEESAVSTLAKLDHLLPAHLARRVRSLHESTASMLWSGSREDRVDAAHLLLLANACSARERVRFSYTDRTRKGSDRLVEPLRLVRSGPRWYLVARDIDRADWRTFRLDRLKAPESVGTRFEHKDPPDPVAMVTEGVTVRSYPYRARIRIPLPVDRATRMMPRTFAVIEGEDAQSTIVELGSTGLYRMVGYLAGLYPPCEVLDPPELRETLRMHAEAIARANSSV
jgi:predicted DNA-binding transcriptional regulator YafY